MINFPKAQPPVPPPPRDPRRSRLWERPLGFILYGILLSLSFGKADEYDRFSWKRVVFGACFYIAFSVPAALVGYHLGRQDENDDRRNGLL